MASGRYILPRQPAGTRIALSKSPLGPDHRGVRMGVIVATRGSLVFVDWDDGAEVIVDSGEMRYFLDRGLLRLTPPPKPRRVRVPREKLVCPTCGHSGKKRCGCPRRGATKPEEWGMRQIGSTSSFPETLTHHAGFGKMTPSSITDRKDDTVSDTETTESEETEGQKQSTLSPKDLAARAGTDAKGFRRFLRSDASGVVDAGQGNRYSFTEAEAESLLERYATWSNGKATRKKGDGETKTKRSRGKKTEGEVEEIDFQSASRRRAAEAADDDLEEIDLDDLDLDDLDGPSEEELGDEPDAETEFTTVESNGAEDLAAEEDEELEEL